MMPCPICGYAAPHAGHLIADCPICGRVVLRVTAMDVPQYRLGPASPDMVMGVDAAGHEVGVVRSLAAKLWERRN